MTPPSSGLANAAGAQRREVTAHTRLYRGGKLVLEGFPAADISEHLADESVTIWLDLRGPGRDELAVLSEERCGTASGPSSTATGATCS
jgi:hypothetical protein